MVLTLILLTWRIWWAPNNASSWQVGLNSALKGLTCCDTEFCPQSVFIFPLTIMLTVIVFINSINSLLCVIMPYVRQDWTYKYYYSWMSGYSSLVPVHRLQRSNRFRLLKDRFLIEVLFSMKRKRGLTFIGPCIANIFAQYNQEDATFHNLFISVRRSACFRRSFRPSSEAQNCTYSFRYLSDGYCYLLLARPG